MVPIELSTVLGNVWITPTNGRHIHVDCNSNGRCCIVKGKPIRFTFHLFSVNGAWTLINPADGRNTFYGYRTDKDQLPSDKQTLLILRAVLPVILEWIKSNAKVMHNAELDYIQNKIDSQHEKAKELEEELTEINEELEKLHYELNEAKKYGPPMEI